MTLKEIFEKHGQCWVAIESSPNEKSYRLLSFSDVIQDKIICEDGAGCSCSVHMASTRSEFVKWEPTKQKKRYWLWNLRGKGGGSWICSWCYLDESGRGTNGATSYDFDKYDHEKIENWFKDVEVES